MSYLLRVQAAAFLIAFACLVFAQDGVSTAGLARSKYFESVSGIPPSREVVVEDFINYHRHELPRPKAGEDIALDLRWLNGFSSKKSYAVLQIGLSTALRHDISHLRALNLCLVIDNSGSMADDQKLEHVKQSVLMLIEKLRPTDILSVVTFDSKARVCVEASPVGDGYNAKEAINNLQPGSSTNLNGGLMLGYQQVATNLDKRDTNRVILLTDGIANVGDIDAESIARNSSGYNDEGIDLSTIAVGRDVNMDLLSTLAKRGHGLFHFVEDYQDMNKVFNDEAQSLLAPVARNAMLEIDGEVDQIYGYEPNRGDGKTLIPLADMNSGMTEVVLAKVNPHSKPIRVRLLYQDPVSDKNLVLAQNAPTQISEENTVDESVQKNFAIALLAQAIHDLAVDRENGSAAEGFGNLNTAVNSVEHMYPRCEDPDINRVLNIAREYREKEDSVTSSEIGSRPTSAHVGYPRGTSTFNGDFRNGNMGFSSELHYVRPADNCLWPVGYTVASTFSRPQLHHLISSQDFAAPDGGQVMFANAGGTGELTLCSATVSCKPHTRYHISFHSISLTPGREWIPTYEIRVNDFRSTPQISSDGTYNTIFTDWTSGNQTTVRLSIVRLPIPHGGGIVGIANIKVVPDP